MSKIFKRFPLILLLCFFDLSCSSLNIRPSFLYSKSYSKNKSLSFHRGPSSFKTQEEFTPLDLQALDSTKPTVCSMTLNSKDEREVFKKHLGDSFNFVELVNPNNTKWLKKGCESQIQCDILVVSGHFGGSFFGSSGRLSMEVLENSSCQSSCKGLFEFPKEVFLFGCNTMAGKQPDSRTMQEYADILYNEHRDVYPTRLMAEEAAAYRYSSLGTQTQDRMKKVFKNARIYGFYSTSPSGKNISPRLHKYFKSLPEDYRSHLKKFPTDEENTFWSKAMTGQYIRSANGAKNSENPICILFGSQPIYKKLSWIDSVFTSKNVLAYAPNINEYLFSLEKRFGPHWDKWPNEEVSYMEHLQFHKRAKAKVGTFLEKPIEGLLNVQFNLLGLGSKLGWYEPSERKVIQRRLLRDLFSTNLTLEQKDLVCSIENIQMDLKLEDLPQEKWNRYTIIALGCVRPPNEEIHMALAKALTDTDKYVREKAAWALGKIKPKSLKVLFFITEFLKHDKSYVRGSAAWALGEIKPLNKEIHMALAQALTDTDSFVRGEAAWALGEIKPKSLKVLFFIAKFLKHDKSYMRSNAARVLGEIKPLNEEISMALAQALTDTNKYVRSNAAWALGEIKPLNEEISMALAQALTDTDLFVRSNAARALGEIKPKSLKVLFFIAEFLKHDKIFVREDAAWVLGNIKPKSLKVLFFIAEFLKHDKSYARENAAKVLGNIKPLNEKIHMALAQALTDTDWWVRYVVTWALGEIKPKSLKVLEVIKTHNPNLHQRILAD